MNIRDLEYISAVARMRHFGKAAQHCNVSQPALSTQIKKLEAELGVQLFERDNRSVKLTDIGKTIIAQAEQALINIDTIRAAASTSSDPLAGEIRLGAIPTIAPYLVPHFVRQAKEELPKLRLQFEENITENLETGLQKGDLDVALLATPPSSSKFESLPLYDETFWVIFPKGHNLRALQDIHTQDLPMDELLLLTEGHCFRDQAIEVCQSWAEPESRMIKATSLETLINLVAAGLGVTLVPAMALSGTLTGHAAVSTVKLKDTKAYRRIFLVFRKSSHRKELVSRLASVIRANLPATVQSIKS